MFFFSLSALLTAWANREAEPLKDRPTGKLKPQLKCSFCPKSYEALLFLEIHVKSTHTNLEYEFQCPDCTDGGFHKDNYQRHRKDKHDDPKRPKQKKDKKK